MLLILYVKDKTIVYLYLLRPKSLSINTLKYERAEFIHLPSLDTLHTQTKYTRRYFPPDQRMVKEKFCEEPSI